MREFNRQYLSIKINVLPKKNDRSRAAMAFVHHELSAENAVIPFSLSLPATPI